MIENRSCTVSCQMLVREAFPLLEAASGSLGNAWHASPLMMRLVFMGEPQFFQDISSLVPLGTTCL